MTEPTKCTFFPSMLETPNNFDLTNIKEEVPELFLSHMREAFPGLKKTIGLLEQVGEKICRQWIAYFRVDLVFIQDKYVPSENMKQRFDIKFRTRSLGRFDHKDTVSSIPEADEKFYTYCLEFFSEKEFIQMKKPIKKVKYEAKDYVVFED